MDPWQPGARIGELVLERKLGQGGMGAVYQGRHQRTGGVYAIKKLASDDAEMRARFVREGQAQAAVDAHPNVLRVHASGEAFGEPYLVMDLAAGGSLEERLRSGPLPLAEAAKLVVALCSGLEHVHSKGVLHRDLKPANVLFDEHGTPKLVDFGLAVLSGRHSLTATGTMIGTPAYMAPEQADGDKRAHDARTDVYGLGAVLYHTLTGEPPFQGASMFNVVKQVLSKPPARPTTLVPDLPADADAVCLKALAKDPTQRYPTAKALGKDLERLAVGEPVMAPSARSARGPLVVAALCVALLLAGGLAVWVTKDSAPGEQQPLPTEQPSDEPPEPDAPAPAGDRNTWLAFALTRPLPGDVVAETLVLQGDVGQSTRALTLRVSSGAWSEEISAKASEQGRFAAAVSLPSGINEVVVEASAEDLSSAPVKIDLRRPPKASELRSWPGFRAGGPGVWSISGPIKIGVGERLVIPGGAQIFFGPEGEIVCKGELWTLGGRGDGQSVLLANLSAGQRWQGIRLEGPKARAVLLGTTLRGGLDIGSLSLDFKPSGTRNGLRVSEGSVFVADSTITGWAALMGGGVFLSNAPLNVLENLDEGVSEKKAFQTQPAISTFINVAFTDNLAGGGREGGGGALAVSLTAIARVRDCRFQGNTAVKDGGAILVKGKRTNPAHLDCVRTTFTANRAGPRGDKKGDGGAVKFDDTVTGSFADCVFRGNSASEDGGAIDYAPAATQTSKDGMRVIRTRFEGNTASSRGGAFEVYQHAWVRFESCEFRGNSATRRGGGAIYARGGETPAILELSRCRFEGNSAPRGPDLMLGSPITLSQAVLDDNGLDPKRVEPGD